MTYIWENTSWPDFEWDKEELSDTLARVSREQGRLLGKMESLGFDLRNEANLQMLTQDVIKSSEIEGETLEPEQVRSSIARRLGLDVGGDVHVDRNVEGVVEMMMNATEKHAEPLTQERLYGWHAALFPTGWSGMVKILVGQWRDDADGPMQVVSGPIGREKVHYEAPPAEKLPEDMDAFLTWFANPPEMDPLIFSGLAHLWFVTIHPFQDGNGRIARAIADMALARSENIGQRFYSMSGQIRKDRNDYYRMLERTQKGDLDVTEWLRWYLECLERSLASANEILAAVLQKARFWERLSDKSLNDRQIKILNRLLDDFKGKMTTSKWAKMGKCSADTALRDINELIAHGALQKDSGGGRSTSYSLVLAQ